MTIQTNPTKKRILLIDDDPFFRKTLVESLKERGHTLTICRYVEYDESPNNYNGFDLALFGSAPAIYKCIQRVKETIQSARSQNPKSNLLYLSVYDKDDRDFSIFKNELNGLAEVVSLWDNPLERIADLIDKRIAESGQKVKRN